MLIIKQATSCLDNAVVGSTAFCMYRFLVVTWFDSKASITHPSAGQGAAGGSEGKMYVFPVIDWAAFRRRGLLVRGIELVPLIALCACWRDKTSISTMILHIWNDEVSLFCICGCFGLHHDGLDVGM